MASITFKGHPLKTSGILPPLGTKAPAFKLLSKDLSEASLADYGNKRKLLNIFLSLDTGVCATSVKKFAQRSSVSGSVILNISKDLPFAQSRFCATEHLPNAETLSAFRSTFARDYGLEILDGPVAGLCARAVIVLDENNVVLYTEQVPEITQEPNYETAFAALRPTAAKT